MDVLGFGNLEAIEPDIETVVALVAKEDDVKDVKGDVEEVEAEEEEGRLMTG